MTPREVGKFVQVDQATVKRWIRLGHLPAVKITAPKGEGGHERWNIEPKDLDNLLKQWSK